MANPEHVAILLKGVADWNAWQAAHLKIDPDLSGAFLAGVKLCTANLAGANLERAVLVEAQLDSANLRGADLTGAALAGAEPRVLPDLTDARGLTSEQLASAHGDEHTVLPVGFRHPAPWQSFEVALAEGVPVANAWRLARAEVPDLSGLSYVARCLSKINLSRAKLVGCDFSGADLTEANLRYASLIEADLTDAKLVGASFESAKLNYARLNGADCAGARLDGADLSGAMLATVSNLTQSQIETAIGDRSTRLPGGLVRPNHWLTFLEAVALAYRQSE